MKQLSNKLLLSCFCSVFSFSAIAGQDLTAKEKQQQSYENSKAVLQKMGLNLLDGEVKIVSSNKMIVDHRGKNDTYVANIKKSLKMFEEQQRNGYVKQPESRAKELLEFKKASSYQFKKYENDYSPTGTHLRHSISELKMAYTFVGVPQSAMTTDLGVAPYGAYKQTTHGDEGDGWDGAIHFFENKNIGTCEFREHNLKLARGGIELIKELTGYQINNKPTVILVTGDDTTGYLYRVSWYDKLFSRDLYCASEKFGNDIKQRVIELATTIEASQ